MWATDIWSRVRRDFTWGLVAAVVALLSAATIAHAGLSTSLCQHPTAARGSIPGSFAVDACFDGQTLVVYNNLDVALGVSTAGSVGRPRRTETDFDLEVDTARLISRDPEVLLPGDTLRFPIGSGSARVKLRGTSVTSLYLLAADLAHFLPIPTSGPVFEAFTGWVSELNDDGHQYLECEQSKSRVHRLECKALLFRNVAFADARFIVHGALALVKSTIGKISGAVLSLIEGSKWAEDQASQLKPILHSGTISLRSSKPRPFPSLVALTRQPFSLCPQVEIPGANAGSPMEIDIFDGPAVTCSVATDQLLKVPALLAQNTWGEIDGWDCIWREVDVVCQKAKVTLYASNPGD